MIVIVCRHAKLKANVLFNPSAMKKVGNNYSMLGKKKKTSQLVNSSQILYSHIVRLRGFWPRPHWMLIIQDCMIHGVNSERTERSSEEMKGAR